MEVYPDNGVLDYVEIIRALYDVGYDGIVMPDHTPHHDDPESKLQGQAFAFGYIKALIQAIEIEP
jgi:mannonate dehydratase